MAISYQWIFASAHLSVISGTTFSSRSTIAWSAKRLAFLSGEATAWDKVTFFCGGTVRITAAPCFNTCNKRVALQPRWTNTNGSVKVYLTLGSSATNGSQTGVHTLLRFACFIQWTIIVYLALIYIVKKKTDMKSLLSFNLKLKPTLVAFSVRITCPATGTATHWSVRSGLTLSILSTRIIKNAWI